MSERPVNPAQASALFLHQAAPPDQQNVQLSLSLGERWPAEHLQQAWQHAVATHPILRSGFRRTASGEYARKEQAQGDLSWTTLDWTGVEPTEILPKWHALMAEDVQKPFDLLAPPLLRITTISLPGGHCHSLVTFPRLLLDEDALFQILCDWLDALEGRARSVPGEDESSASGPQPARGDWWAQLLAESPSPTRLRLAAHVAASTPAKSASFQSVLGRDLSKSIETAAQNLGVSARDLFLGAWSFLLSRLSGQERVLFLAQAHLPASIDADGARSENILPFLAEPSGSQTIAEYLRKVARAEKEREDNAGIPLDRALTLARPERNLRDLEVLFHWSPPALNSRIHDAYPRWINLDAKWHSQPERPLTLEVRADYPFELKLSFDEAHFPPAQAEQLMRRLELAIDEFVTDPQAKLSDACILTDAEWAAFRLTPPTSEPPPSGKTFLEKIEEAIVENPKAVAVHGPGEATLTYEELDSLADALAAHLRRENLAEGWNIAICLTPTSWLPVATLASLRAGDTCLPLDPHEPAEWLRQAAEACDAELVICDSRSAASFEGLSKKILIIDQQWETVATGTDIPPRMEPAKIPFLLASPDAEKSIVCKPLQPATLSASAEALTQLLGLQGGDRVSLLYRPGTPAFIETLVSTLGAGAAIFVTEEDEFSLAAVAASCQHLLLTSWQWRSWVAESLAEQRPLSESLRSVCVEAAPFPPAVYAHWQLINRGQAVWSSFLSPQGFCGQSLRFTSPDRPGSMPQLLAIPIGLPGWGIKSRLNDHAGQPLAPHFPGTLEISLKKDNVWQSQAPAWRDAHGWIHFVPSKADLVERALSELGSVLEAHAVEDETHGILAWIIRADRSTDLPSEFFTGMAAHLPADLRPDSLFAVSHFSLTLDGRIDPSKLPQPAPPAPPVAAAAPIPATVATPRPAPVQEIREWEPLVLLSKTEDTPTLFMIHGLEGDAAAYKPLSSLLAEEWTIYGTSARGLSDPRACHRDIPSEAASLVEAISTLDPEGPYHLCGHGFGAILAFEIAHQLRVAGHEVPFLMLLGSSAPELEQKPDWKKSLLGLFGGKSSKTLPLVGTSTPVSEAHLKALQNYKTKPFDGPAGLVLAVDQGKETETAWQACVPDFFLERMSCVAADMLAEPAVKRLAVILRDCSLTSDEEDGA